MAALECAVCLEPYDLTKHVPRILPCSGAHDLCASCVSELRPNGEAFACPQCRDDIPSGARINENRLLLQTLRHKGHAAGQAAALRAAKRPKRRANPTPSGGFATSTVQVIAAAGALLLAVLAVYLWRLWPAPTPIDALLEPAALWSEALMALNEGRNADAAWLMLIALFLNWSYNDGRYLPDIKRALDGCSDCGLWALPLRPMVSVHGTMASENVYSRFESTYDGLAAAFVSGRKDSNWRSLSSAPFSGHEDRLAFAAACAAVFYARDLSRAFMQSSAAGSNSKALQLGRQAKNYVSLAATHIQPERYLTLMFEHAYSHRQIMAMAEGTMWSQRFQAAAPTRPNAHWRSILERDVYGERNAREATKLARSSMTLDEKIQWMADTAEQADSKHVNEESRYLLRKQAGRTR